MRNPQPFVVTQNAKPLFTVYAYSLEQARALVAAKVASETTVVGPVSLDGVRFTLPIGILTDGSLFYDNPHMFGRATAHPASRPGDKT